VEFDNLIMWEFDNYHILFMKKYILLLSPLMVCQSAAQEHLQGADTAFWSVVPRNARIEKVAGGLTPSCTPAEKPTAWLLTAKDGFTFANMSAARLCVWTKGGANAP
jgi:hypothetical protein